MASSPRASFFLLVLLLLGSALVAGCAIFARDDAHRYEKPLVSVLAFENRAHHPFDWQIGEGVAELLEASLYGTGQFRVLDRGDLEAILAEQDFQTTGRTREEQSVPGGRLKNAHYLVKGVVTEFAHVSGSGWDLGVGALRLGGGGVHAVVDIALKAIDVESGEVVYTRVVEGRVYTGETNLRAVYGDVAFGGHRFNQTPLGRALREALDEAVADLSDRIARRPWRPVVAGVVSEGIVMTGGLDRRIEVGSRWRVRRAGASIVDPKTGDVLGREPGTTVGLVRVKRVEALYSIAAIEAGEGFERGQPLEAEPEPVASLDQAACCTR